MTNITAIGMGSMGSALVAAYLSASFKVTIWNRSADRPSVQEAIQAGATLKQDISAAISQPSDAIIICVLDYDAIYTLLARLPAGSLQGKTVVNLTNGTPKQAEAMAVWMKDQDVAAYVDGAVMVTPTMVQSPHSLLIYSGESQAVFDNLASVLSPLGKALYFGEQASAAAAVDIAALSGMYGMFLGGILGMRLLQKMGAEATPATEQITAPVVAALSGHLVKMAREMDAKDWLQGRENPLRMQLAGVNNIREALGDAEIDDGGLFGALGGLFSSALERYGEDAGVAAAAQFADKKT